MDNLNRNEKEHMTPIEVLKMLKSKIDEAELNKFNYVLETNDVEAINQALHIADVVCSYSPFPQSLKAGKKYRILAKHKDSVAIIDDTKELVIYNKCYFDLA